jgi:alkylation response protein AidB-like acyl-CoA dehydrogenase
MADEIDDARQLPDRLVDKLTDAGFFRMMLDRELGGLEAEPLTAAQVVETLSKVSPSVGWVVMIIASTNFWAARTLPDEAVREVFTPGEPVNVTGNLVPHRRAVKTDGGWRVSGQWPLGSGCHHSHWAASGGWLHDEQGPIIEDGIPAWRVFYTPIGDCHILDTWHSTGLRGTGSHDYTMDEVFVPDRLVTRHPLRAPSLRSSRHYAYSAVVIGSMASVARGAIDSLIEIFGEKQELPSSRLSSSIFDKQADLGAAEALVGSARAYLHATLSQVWDRVIAGEPLTSELRARFRLACTNAATASVAAADLAYRAGGTDSIYTSSPVERFFRDVHTVAAHVAMRPSTLADGGALLLGQEPNIPGF